MMSCGEVRDAMHRYLDDELPECEVTRLESHLLDCGACREEHGRWQDVVDAVRGRERPIGLRRTRRRACAS